MRHRKKTKILDRKKDPRKALFRSLATSLVMYEKIQTTEAKAKALRPIIEKLITKAKKGDLHARRELIKYLYLENAVKKMIEEIGPRYKDRMGGYTRIIKTNARQGDAAKMAIIEFV
jgi:large subunit ribosomal protein L17